MRLHEGKRGLHMEHLFVHETQRGRGIGTALVAAALQHARTLGCVNLGVGTAPGNPCAAAFYLREGFTEVAQRGRHFSMAL